MAQPDVQLQQLETDLTTYRAAGDHESEARTLNAIGVHHQQQGRLDEALACYQESLAINRTIGHIRGQAVTLANAALIMQSRARQTDALAAFQQSLVLRRELNDTEGEALMLWYIGRTLVILERFADAESSLGEALARFELLGSPSAEPVRGALERVRLRLDNQA